MTRMMLVTAAIAASSLVTVLAVRRDDVSKTPDAAQVLAPLSSPVEPESAAAAPLPVEGVGHVRGADSAPVTVVEFSDFGCPYCGTFALGTYPTLHEEYVATGKVQWRHVPFVMGMFPNGAEAARAAECATEQGEDAFWAMHHLLYERQTAWKSVRDPKPGFTEFAAEIGLKQAQFASCYDQDRSASRVAAGNALAARSGVRATPTFFVNGRRVQGALPLEQFRMILDAAASR